MRTIVPASLLGLLATVAVARAQPAPPAPPAPAEPVGAAPGMRLATGQAPVVGGNATGARERAFDEAIRQAVEAALNEVVDPATRAAQTKTVKALLARPRVFVPRYRTLEEGEANGTYSVRVEVEVDEGALRRKLERPGGATLPEPRSASSGIAIVAADASPASRALAGALVTALLSAGVRARAGTPEAASGVRVTAELADEGVVRGTGRSSFACRADIRADGSPAAPVAPQTASTRVFAASPEAAQGDCVARMAGDLGRRLAAALPSAGAAPSGDLRAVTVDAELVEPGAVPALLKGVRSLGLVSAAELTRVAAGRAEIRLRARASTAALAAALPRTAGAPVVISDVQVAGDVIRVRARLRAPAVAAPAPGETTP